MTVPANTYGQPGVYVTETLIAPPPSQNITSPSVAGFAGEHWRGPTGVAIKCSSWGQFLQYYGGFNPNSVPILANQWLPYAVYEFFNNGGQQCYINRIAASGLPGAVASATFYDGQATANATLKLSAGFLGVGNNLTPNPYPNVGTWGNSLYAQITVPQGGVAAGTGNFNLTIYFGGTNPGNIVESWQSLNMNPASTRYAPTVINSPTNGSMWVIATDLFSTALPPLNSPSTQTIPTQLTGGTDTGDPSVLDRQNAVTYGNAASGFDQVPGVLNINMPGEANTAVLGTAIGYASGGSSGRPYSFIVIDSPQGASVATAQSFMQTLQGLNNSSYAALYYPWIIGINPASSALQANLDMPPGGFVLGQMTQVDTAQGPWYAPAGLTTDLTGVVQLERNLAPADFTNLNQSNINALKPLPNGQIIIWGARTFLTELTDVYVPIRRTLNYVESQLSANLLYAIFQPNDSVLWGQITTTCTQFLQGMAARNAFSGNTPAQQYYVVCNASNNTPTTIQQGIVNVTVGMALNYPAEFIQLNIQQFQNTGVTTTSVSL